MQDHPTTALRIPSWMRRRLARHLARHAPRRRGPMVLRWMRFDQRAGRGARQAEARGADNVVYLRPPAETGRG